MRRRLATGNKFSTPTTEQTEKAGNALSDALFGGKNDDAVKDWLHEHLEYRLPGAEKILASDEDRPGDEMPDEKLPGLLIDMFTTEIFAGGSKEKIGGYHLRDKILEVVVLRIKSRRDFASRTGGAFVSKFVTKPVGFVKNIFYF